MNFQITRKPLPKKNVAHSTALQMQPGECVEGLLAKDAVKLRDAIDELHGQGSAVAQLIDLNRYTWTVWRK